MSSTYRRRDFLKHTMTVAAAMELGVILRPEIARAAAAKNDPASHLKLAWTGKLKWDNVVDITTVSGGDWAQRLANAQKQLTARGGGVVYFPAGKYVFTDSITVADGIVLRGAEPKVADAKSEAYSPPTVFEFPRYRPKFDGDGTPIETAFKGIYLDDPAGASNCGMVNVSLNRAHIHLGQAEGYKCGVNRIIYGCVLRNAAIAEPRVPDIALGQKPWQRFTKWHWAAVSVKTYENALLANNRLIKSNDSFLMKGYVIQSRDKNVGTKEYDVWFDYDFRPGLECNDACVGAPGGEEPSGTPETHPWGFRKGIVICDNAIYSTGRNAIEFSGDGTICARNYIRFPDDIWRQTVMGFRESKGSSTTDTRPVQMRGWRWVVEDNDYEVFRNWASDHAYHINDGEGLMHENHCNAHIKDSRLTNNRGNAYLSLFKTGGIDGLHIEGNDITVDRDMAIFVESDHSDTHKGPCRNVSIVNNRTVGGILIKGDPASNNVVKGNVNRGQIAPLKNHANAKLENNKGYEVQT
ncbi:MAG: hypothetical protein JW720_08135 [Sedimentisphaerales bacterium]|nr:hypothetical protein [Sedimentisphaerales bacterium]